MLHNSSFSDKTWIHANNYGFNLPYIAVNVPLPSSEQVYSEAMSMAWPQVLTFAGACVGIVGITLIVRAFTR